MAEAVQAYRRIRVNSPLGADALLFRRMAASEALSQPFAIDLDLLSDNPEIKGDQLLGQPMTIAIDPAVDGAEVRPFPSIGSPIAAPSIRYASYAVRLRPLAVVSAQHPRTVAHTGVIMGRKYARAG
ncbi:MAG: hypothetical protein IPK78_03080 [Rhodospirillales bacterium]|nr:hypothetical protein [Rhodospirillales bacterium]